VEAQEDFRILKKRGIILAVVLGLVVLFPPFHTRSIVHVKRSWMSAILDRNTSFILVPPSQDTKEGHLTYPWTVYWSRLLIELVVVAGSGMLLAGPRRIYRTVKSRQ